MAHKPFSLTANVSLKHGQPFITWLYTLCCISLAMELHFLHRRFDHSAVEKIRTVLRHERPNDVTPSAI